MVEYQYWKADNCDRVSLAEKSRILSAINASHGGIENEKV